nr:DUF3102 domain-containing protein [Dehalobacter sp.]
MKHVPNYSTLNNLGHALSEVVNIFGRAPHDVSKEQKGLTTIMVDSVTDRTPLVIAAEINTIKRQMEKIFLVHAIEIGRRLKEAKDLLPHGGWGKWLEESVSYSQITADRLMRIYSVYGSNQPSLLRAGAGTAEFDLLSGSDSSGTPAGKPGSVPCRNGCRRPEHASVKKGC